MMSLKLQILKNRVTSQACYYMTKIIQSKRWKDGMIVTNQELWRLKSWVLLSRPLIVHSYTLSIKETLFLSQFFQHFFTLKKFSIFSQEWPLFIVEY